MADKAPTRLSDLTDGRVDVLWIDPRLVQIQPGNIRDFTDPDNVEHVEEIKASIKSNGWRRNFPVVLKFVNGEAHLVPGGGETRMRAVLDLIAEGMPIEKITCISVAGGQNDADLLFSQRGDNLGKRFSPLEDALLIKRLQGLGVDDEEIMRRGPFTPQKFQESIRLLELPETLRTYIKRGNVAATFALKLVDDYGVERATETIAAGVTAAITAGKKVTAKTVSRTVNKARGYRYTHDDGKHMIRAFQEVYALTDGSQRKIRQIIRNVLENYGAPLQAEDAA